MPKVFIILYKVYLRVVENGRPSANRDSGMLEALGYMARYQIEKCNAKYV